MPNGMICPRGFKNVGSNKKLPRGLFEDPFLLTFELESNTIFEPSTFSRYWNFFNSPDSRMNCSTSGEHERAIIFAELSNSEKLVKILNYGLLRCVKEAQDKNPL